MQRRRAISLLHRLRGPQGPHAKSSAMSDTTSLYVAMASARSPPPADVPLPKSSPVGSAACFCSAPCTTTTPTAARTRHGAPGSPKTRPLQRRPPPRSQDDPALRCVYPHGAADVGAGEPVEGGVNLLSRCAVRAVRCSEPVVNEKQREVGGYPRRRHDRRSPRVRRRERSSSRSRTRSPPVRRWTRLRALARKPCRSRCHSHICDRPPPTSCRRACH